MKHLVVTAHPVPDSFTMALARAYTTELERLGHDLRIRDLYRMEFNPVLPAHELLPAGARNPMESDIGQAQDDIRAADVLTVIYPLWWLSMPAMMKGYIDRVFARGFAYESEGGIVRGLLSGKKAVLITVSGAPLAPLVASGRWQAVERLQDTHIFQSTGFDLLEHLHFDQIVPDITRDLTEHHMERVQACARQHFPAA